MIARKMSGNVPRLLPIFRMNLPSAVPLWSIILTISRSDFPLSL